MEFSDTGAILIEYLIQEIPNEQDVLYELDEIIEEIKYSPEKVVRFLELYKEDYAYTNNLCPICNGKIVTTKVTTGERLEYNGFTVEREEAIIQCSECGETF